MTLFTEIGEQYANELLSWGGIDFIQIAIKHIKNLNTEVHTPALRLCSNLFHYCHMQAEHFI